MLLMIILIVFNLFCLINSFFIKDKMAYYLLAALVYASQLAALIAGYIHLRSGYQKTKADYYKAFLLLTALSYIFAMIYQVLTNGFDIAVVFRIVYIAILFVLAFAKDVGEKNTWLLFYILLASDQIALILRLIDILPASRPVNTNIALIIMVVTTRVLLGSIGLSIYGKYADKQNRGTN